MEKCTKEHTTFHKLICLGEHWKVMITLFCSSRCTCDCIWRFLPLNYLKVAFWSSRFVQNSASWQSSQIQLLSSFLLFFGHKMRYFICRKAGKSYLLTGSFRFRTFWHKLTTNDRSDFTGSNIWNRNVKKKYITPPVAQANDNWWHETWEYVN